MRNTELFDSKMKQYLGKEREQKLANELEIIIEKCKENERKKYKCIKHKSIVSECITFRIDNKEYINACDKNGCVVFNEQWANKILESELENKDDVYNAFILTIGHELTHRYTTPKNILGLCKVLEFIRMLIIIFTIVLLLLFAIDVYDREISSLIISNLFIIFVSLCIFLTPWMRKWNKFLWWVDEVHADYGGIDLLLNGNIKQGLNALEYKKECKDPKDKNIEHPTWEKRIEYVKNYNKFDEILISKIAEDVKFRCKKAIKYASALYNIVELNESST